MKKKSIFLFTFLIVLSLFSTISLAADCLTEYTTPGTYTCTMPVGVTSIDITAMGGGGGGATAGVTIVCGNNCWNTIFGGGGSSGEERSLTHSISLGEENNVIITVGKGGAANANGDSSKVSIKSVDILTSLGGKAASGQTAGASVGVGSYAGGIGGSTQDNGPVIGSNTAGTSGAGPNGGTSGITGGGGGAGSSSVGGKGGVSAGSKGGGGGGGGGSGGIGFAGGDGYVKLDFVVPLCDVNADDICFNGIDENCDGVDSNQIVTPDESYCECNSLNLGKSINDGEDICAYDKWTDQYEWRHATSDYFKMFSINSNISIISNSQKWYYCNANPTSVTINQQIIPPIIIPAGSKTVTSSESWTVPTGVTSISVTVVGAGGGGGGGSGKPDGNSNSQWAGGGGGGGGGGTVTRTIAVSPRHVYTLNIGNGGSGGTGILDGTAGKGTDGESTSAFGLTAPGGLGGHGAIGYCCGGDPGNNVGGGGGDATAGTGGTGARGGSGPSEGPHISPTDATGTNAGASGTDGTLGQTAGGGGGGTLGPGGYGGKGGNPGTIGSSGNIGGGGGGGGGIQNQVIGAAGGNGGNGFVTISWDGATISPPSISTPVPVSSLSSTQAISDKKSFPNVQAGSLPEDTAGITIDQSNLNIVLCDDETSSCDLNSDLTGVASSNEEIIYSPTENINESFICYKNSGVNNIAECCYDNCHNVNIDDNTKGLRTFRNGANLKSILTFDIFDDNGFLGNGMNVETLSSTKRDILFGDSIPVDMRNFALFGSFSFDIKSSLNLSNNLTIIFLKNSAVLQTFPLTSYTPYTSSSVWHHVKISPLSLFGNLNDVSQVKLHYAGTAPIQIQVDGMYLGDNNPVCSGNGNVWLSDLDPVSSQYDNEVYQSACNGVRSFGWTGSKCCGDDFNEYYNDVFSGCFNGYAVANDTTAKTAVNNNQLKDLLWINEGQTEGNFYQCEFSPTYTTICDVKSLCASGETEVLQMSEETNAHVSKDGSYSKKLCCDSSKLAQIKSDNKIYLSGDTNAHVSTTSISGYDKQVTIGNNTGGVSCNLYADSCPSNYASLFSLSAETNAHIAKPFSYNLNYCCNVVGKSVPIIKYTIPLIPQASTACEVKGSYFCDYNNTWNDADLNDLTPIIKAKQRNTSSLISETAPAMAQDNTIPQSCCPANYCWNGTSCIDGTVNYSKSNVVPIGQVYLNGSLTTKDDYGVICSQGEWNVAERKYEPFNHYSGYCLLNSQCYYEENGNAKCYNNNTIVNDTSVVGELSDFYCQNGNWTTRTKFLADSMLEIGESESGSPPFSIFCDDINMQTSLNDVNYILSLSNGVVSLENYSANFKESPDKNSVCILSIDGNNNGVFGDYSDNEDNSDKVVIGIPLKKEWNENGGFFVDFSDCNHQFENNGYEACINPVAFNDKNLWIYYNNVTKSIMFSEKSFSVGEKSDIFSKIKNWVMEFLGLKSSSGSATSYKSISHAIYFNYSNLLSNHLYYYKNGNKEITAVKEYKYHSTTYKYFIYSNYTGFNLPLCKKEAGGVAFTPPRTGTASKNDITCSEDNSTIIMVLDPSEIDNPRINFWNDLTARVRPK